ncbi:hypothetical protein EXN66_Car017829 [Channa argus]|uniref:Uncharacterized protein n=1 Tax=Channa argus TaxID=215402 RepID=A0A6G1QHJ8_CHAAH|nr:hypothetical protein EXN66_Car017829 [Channa argus]
MGNPQSTEHFMLSQRVQLLLVVRYLHMITCVLVRVNLFICIHVCVSVCVSGSPEKDVWVYGLCVFCAS